jgi:hypothetical protein
MERLFTNYELEPLKKKWGTILTPISNQRKLSCGEKYKKAGHWLTTMLDFFFLELSELLLNQFQTMTNPSTPNMFFFKWE